MSFIQKTYKDSFGIKQNYRKRWSFFWGGLFAFWGIAFFAQTVPSSEPTELVFDFESGNLDDSLWIVAEGLNDKPIGSREKLFWFDSVYPKQGTFYLTTLESSQDDKTHESNRCVLESPVFVPAEGTFRFLIGGGNIPETWLALCVVQPNGDIEEKEQFRGQSAQTMDEVTLDLSPYIGQPLLFRLVDRGTGSWSYLHLDNFRGVGRIDQEITRIRRDFLQRTRQIAQTDSLIQRLDSLLAQEFEGENADSLKNRTVRLQEKIAVLKSQMSSSIKQSDSISPQKENAKTRQQSDFLTQNSETQQNSEELQQDSEALTQDSETFAQTTKTFAQQAQTLERDILIDDPAISGRSFLYISRPQYPFEHHNTETVYQTDDICTHLMPQSGSALKLWNPETDEVHTLLDVPEGIVRDPCVHFEGDRILLSIRWNIKDDFHIYEMDLREKNPWTTVFTRETLHQLTFGSGLSDIDPQYLPEGRIVFSSTREPKYCMCNRHIMANLFTMNADGSNILQIGHSTLYEGHSSLLPDGRILYYRWEYVDRNFSDAEGVWTVNPDGTNHALFWGNNTESPAATIDPHILPGSSSEFVCTMTGCHISPWGAIGVIDRKKGLDGKEPVLQVWPQEAWNLIGTYTGNSYDNLLQLPQFFEDPYPLDRDHILASGTIPANQLDDEFSEATAERGITGLWLLTMDGKMRLIHNDPIGCFDPMPLEESEKPPMIVNRVDLSKENGSFYVTNVNEGFGMSDVPRGMAKYIRVIESPEKRFWTNPSWWGVDSLGAQQAPAMNWDDFSNKRILGTASIEEDGSVYFNVPADRFVYFQLLDENKEMIQSMRSGVIVRPGETNGCYGCHEDRLETPESNQMTIAMRQKPQELRLEFNRSPFLFSYTEEVQPILDRYCVSCHDWPIENAVLDNIISDNVISEKASLEKTASETAASENATSELAMLKEENSAKLALIRKQASDQMVLCGDLNPVFNCSYWQLRDKKAVAVIGSAFAEKLKPLVWGARKSRLMEIFRKGHDQGGPIDQMREELGLSQIDPAEIEMIAAWIDLNAPYYPDFSSGFPNNPYGRSPLTFEETQELAALTGSTSIQLEMVLNQRPNSILESGISFTRPERSPCLTKWNTDELRDSAEYQRALALICSGAERLQQTPREDMPHWKLTNPIEIRREVKYNVFEEKAQRMKKAILNGDILLDQDNQLPFDLCFPQ